MNTVDAARSYLGTKFHHQGRVPGVGLDCIGVVVCALTECNIPVVDKTGYGRIPSQGLFEQSVDEYCDRINIEDLKEGDFMLFAWRAEAMHIAIVSNIAPLTIIHAYSEVGRVVENEVDEKWRSRLCGCYRLRG